MAFQVSSHAFRKGCFLFVFLATSIYHSKASCPDLAILGTMHTITTYIQGENYNVATWVRPHDGQNVVICSPLDQCNGDDGYSAFGNSSQSTLIIVRVRLTEDVGNWTIKLSPNTTIIPVCDLTAAKIPGCDVSADMDTDDLEEGVNLTLTATIAGFYCTNQHSFNITTGNVTDELYAGDSATAEDDRVLSTTFNVTESYFGPVTVNFTCEESQWELPCTGVDYLRKRIPTTTTPTTTPTTALSTTGSTDNSPSSTSSPDISSATIPTATTISTESPPVSTGRPGIPGSTGGTPVLSGDDPDYVLIGGIIGGVVAFIIISVVIFFVCRKIILPTYEKYIVNKTAKPTFDNGSVAGNAAHQHIDMKERI